MPAFFPPFFFSKWRGGRDCFLTVIFLVWLVADVATSQVSQLILIEEQARREKAGLPDLSSGASQACYYYYYYYFFFCS